MYKDRFQKCLDEDVMSASAMATGNNSTGDTAGSFGNVDSYAPGDARMPRALGDVDLTKRKKKKKKKSKISHDDTVKGSTRPVMQSRNSGMQGPGNKINHGFM